MIDARLYGLNRRNLGGQHPVQALAIATRPIPSRSRHGLRLGAGLGGADKLAEKSFRALKSIKILASPQGVREYEKATQEVFTVPDGLIDRLD